MDQEIVVVEDVEEIIFNVEVEIINEEIVVVALVKITITAVVVLVIFDVVEAVILSTNKIIIVQNNFRQQRGRGNTIPGFNRRNTGGDKPTATYNPLNRDANPTTTKQQSQPQAAPRRQQGSVFNKIRPNQNVTALRRRMVAAQQALNRATRTLAAMPRIRQQRQRSLQQPQKLRNIITRNKLVHGGGGGVGAIRKRLNTGRKLTGRGGARRMFV